MNPSYPTPSFNPASNAPPILHAPMPTSYPPYAMHMPQPQPYPYMMMPHPPMMQQQPQFQLPNHGFPPMYAFPTHNFAPMPFRQPFFPVNQHPFAPSPQPAVPQQDIAPACATPTTSRVKLHNTSLNTSLPVGSTSFNDSSYRYNPLSARGRSRDHSLIIDLNTSSSDRSFQQSFIDPHEMANNNELISYCVTELSRKQLTEQELLVKVSKSRRFKKFGINNLPVAISIILNTFPCFVSRTVVLKNGSNDLQPISKTLWQTDKRYSKPRGSKLNVTMFEIPEQHTGDGGEVLSVLGDIASLKLDENQPPTTIASMEKIMEGIKV